MADPTDEQTLVDVIRGFRDRGFKADFTVAEGALRCGSCGQRIEPEDVEIVDVGRYEGISDPGEEAVVFALRCPNCETLGILLATYGPDASAEEAEVMVRLGDGRR